MSAVRDPLRFRPLIKRTLWGGRKLGERLGKPIGEGTDYAESWEVVDHGEDQSVVDGGVFDGMTLAALMDQFGDALLGPGLARHSFPLLLKYLDCNRVLSVQVHPNDAQGSRLDPPDLGKTEAWYVVEAEEDAVIFAGLQEGVGREEFRAAIDSGHCEQVLHQFKPRAGDVVFIPAGTVHALGAGLVIAEIQQSSDTTFRLFDWNRVDAEGNARPLHLDQGLEVTDYVSGPIHPIRGDDERRGRQTVVSCDKFTLDLVCRGTAELGDRPHFEILTVPRGTATLTIGNDPTTLHTGETRLLPANIPAGTVEVGEDSVAMLCGPWRPR